MLAALDESQRAASSSFDSISAAIRRFSGGVVGGMSIAGVDIEDFMPTPDFEVEDFYTENFTSTCNCSECETYRERDAEIRRKVTVTATQVADLDLYEKFGSSFEYFFREVRKDTLR